MKKLLWYLVVYFGAQTFAVAQVGWGEVGPGQFEVTVCPFDSTAGAMVLFNRCVISFKYDEGELITVYNIRKRIQIFKREEFDRGTIKLNFYSAKDEERITEIKAQTINAGSNGKPHITEVDKKSFFDEKVSDRVSAKKFVFTDMKEGSIIDYEYTLESKEFRILKEWVFQSDIPVLRSYVKLQAPSFLNYTSILESLVRLSESSSEKLDKQIAVNSFSGQAKGAFDNLDLRITESIYAMNNVPAIKEEDYVTSMDDYIAKMSFVLSGYSIWGNSEGAESKKFVTNWDDRLHELLMSKDFGLYLNGIGDHLKIAKEIGARKTNPLEKARAIYQHVTSKMSWNGNFRLLPTGRLGKVYEEGTGNSADINLILLDMLRAAGLDADPVLVSTRSHGKVQKLVPDISQFNHVIVLLKTDSESVFMDATSPVRPFGLLAAPDLNSAGLCMQPAGWHWVNIKPFQKSAENIMSSLQLNEQGELNDNTIITAIGYDAVNIRNDLMTKPAAECIKEEFIAGPDEEITDVKVENKTDVEQKLKLTFTAIQKPENTGSNRIYLKPFVLKFRSENPFKLSKRSYPVSFGYPFEENQITSVTIPTNYKVSELPKSMQVKLSDESATFILLVASNDRNIQISASLKVCKEEYKPEVYESLKNLFARVIDAYNSTIVLEKQ